MLAGGGQKRPKTVKKRKILAYFAGQLCLVLHTKSATSACSRCMILYMKVQ